MLLSKTKISLKGMRPVRIHENRSIKFVKSGKKRCPEYGNKLANSIKKGPNLAFWNKFGKAKPRDMPSNYSKIFFRAWQYKPLLPRQIYTHQKN